MNLFLHYLSALFVLIFTYQADAAHNQAVLPVPIDLIPLLEWIYMNRPQEDAKKAIAENIAQNQSIGRAYVIGAALSPKHGDPKTVLNTILCKRILFNQGLINLSGELFLYHYVTGYRGYGVGFAWGFRPIYLSDFEKSEDLKAITFHLTRNKLDLEIDIVALSIEKAWIDYSMITASALIKKYGSCAHKKVSDLIQNRMALIKAPAKQDIYDEALKTPLFIDALITPEEYQKTVSLYPVLSLEEHPGAARKDGSFLWELYQHTFISVEEYLKKRALMNLSTAPSTQYVQKMATKRSLPDQCSLIQATVLKALLAEKFHNFAENAKQRQAVSDILNGAA
jgi:hypothetical protein